jgi:hypothetical protein
MHRSKDRRYSITSSARASSDVGTSRPSAFAVLRLMTNLLAIHCPRGDIASMLFRRKIYLPAVSLTMFKSRFQIAGGALTIAALSASAVAQNPQASINTLIDLEAALLACWVPPPMQQSRPGMQITVLMSFKRNGELFEQPRIVFQSREASETQRSSYRIAVGQTLKRCASLRFTEALGNTLAGQPLTMTLVDDRKQTR